MAASTISHNTPTPGSITWTAFNMAYAGKSYPVPAGSTAGRFVWWEYRNGTPAVLAGDVLPDLTADDTVLFLNKGGIGSLLPETNIVDGSLIVEESIMAPAIAADQINGTHIVAGAIEAEHVAAGAITADELSVGTVSNNLAANGSFEDFNADGTIIGWEVTAMTGGTIQPVTGVASAGSIAIQFDGTTTTSVLKLRQAPAKFIPVSSASNRRWYVSARMGAGTATTRGGYLRVGWYDANKVIISTQDVYTNGPLTTSFVVQEGQVTPPATARFMGVEVHLNAPNVATKMYVDEVNVYEVLVSARIGDGEVTAAKIKGDAIDGKTITGATVQTAASGARIVMDSTGLNGWDANNINYLKADASGIQVTGTLIARGPASVNYLNVVTGPQTQTRLNGTAVEAIPGLAFVPDGESPLAPTRMRGGIMSPDGVAVTLQGGTPVGWVPDGADNTPAKIVLDTNDVAVAASNNGGVNVTGATFSASAGLGNASVSGASATINARTSTGIKLASFGDVTLEKYGYAGTPQNLKGVDNLAAKSLTINGYSEQALQPLDPANWAVTGTVWVEPFAGGRRATVRVTPMYQGSTGLTITTAGYTSIGAVIPTSARSSTGGSAYMPGQVVGAGRNDSVVVYIESNGGTIALRAMDANFTMTSGALFSVLFMYQM